MTDTIEERGKTARIILETLLERTDNDEAINVLLTAVSLAITIGGMPHVRARCVQLRALADHLQADAAMRGPTS